jgi:3-oxoacyl-[acyl-carrier protein] reductase
MQELEGKVILITGASRGLGLAMAQGMAAAGAHLVITARPGSEARLARVAAAIAQSGATGKLLQVTGDITRPADCEHVIGKVRERFGTLDVLFNNAGLGMDRVGPRTTDDRQFYNVDFETWRGIVDTNINGTFLMTRAVLPLFMGRGEGRIVNLTTSYATMLREGFSPYGPCKAAVEALTVVWAKDLAGTGITVNSLCPGGAADTGMMPREDFPDRTQLLAPSVMIAPAVWLASDASRGVTGMRIVAKHWDAALPPAEAFRRAASRMTIGDQR